MARSLLLLALLAGAAQQGRSQLVVDDFNRPNSNIVGNGWQEVESVSPTSVAIASNGVTMSGAATGVDFISRVSPGAYSPVLSANTCQLVWRFNMRSTRLNPTGFNAGNFGMAVVLAGSDGDLRQGTGYAVALGTPSTSVDPVRIVRYNGGLDASANLTTIAAYGDFGNEYLSIAVTYDPYSNAWRLYVNSAANGYPASPAVIGAPQATGSDGTLAASPLPYIGCYYVHGSTSTERARFDNIIVSGDCSTRFDFDMAAATTSESAGMFSIPVRVTNPSGMVDSWVDVQLASGDPSRIAGFTGTTLHFLGPNAALLNVPLTVVSDGACTGDVQLGFQLANPAGGQGTPLVGAQSQFTLTITDDQRSAATLLEESFESDGSGTRYALSMPLAAPSTNAYFMNGTAGELAGLGCFAATGQDGDRLMAVENLSALSGVPEAVITFNEFDVKGVSDITLSIKAGAVNSYRYDLVSADRDFLILEVRMDGGPWTVRGAFRAQGSNSKLRVDTDLNGSGDGTVLTPALQPFQFQVPVQGERMQLRVRARSTAGGEEIAFDDVKVEGNRCRPMYYSQGSGAHTDAIWSTLSEGPGIALNWDDHTIGYTVQAGHVVNAAPGDIMASSLVIEEGGAFDLGIASLELRGDRLLAAGAFNGMDGNLAIRTTDRFSIEGDALCQLNDVIVDAPAGADMSGNWEIHGTLLLERGDFDATTGDVVLRSTENGTGGLGPVSPNADYLGELVMERYIPGGATNWRFLGAPVHGAQVADWQDDFFTAGYPGSQYPGFSQGGNPWPSIRYYIESVNGPSQNDGLVGVISSAMPLEAGRGFAAWSGDNLNTTAPFVVDVRGEPNIAHEPIVLPMTHTDYGQGSDGWNLVSNPLPSAIDFGALNFSPDVTNMYWIFNPATGSMATWNGEEGTNGANGIIQSSQGFWLRTKGPNMAVSVPESAKVDEDSGGVFGGGKSNRAPSYVRLRIHSAINSYSDETLVLFHTGSPGYNGEDVPKLIFSHPEAPQIGTMAETGQWIAINAYGPYSTDIVIPLAVDVAVGGQYTITASELRNVGLSCLRIEDLQNGTVTPLAEGMGYTFQMAANEDPGIVRFRLLGSAPLPLTSQPASCAGIDDGGASVVLAQAATVTWSFGSGSVIATAEVPAGGTADINGLFAGDYAVSVSAVQGCSSLEASFVIEQPAALTAQGSVTNASCAGTSDGSIELTISGGTEPYAVSWSNGTDAQTLMAQPGTYTASLTDGNGCTTIAGPYDVPASGLALAVAIGPAQPVQALSEVEFSSTGSMADEYSWEFGDGTTSDSSDPVHAYELPGDYLVRLVAYAEGCSDTTFVTVAVEVNTAVQEALGPDVNAWFADGRLFIRSERVCCGPIRLEVINAAGQLQLTRTIPSSTGRIEVPCPGLPEGTWFLRLTYNDSSRTIPFVVTE